MRTVIIYLSKYISRRVKRLASLPSLLKEINLSVTKQEKLGHQHIGFDKIKHKLFLVKKRGNRLVCWIVNLQDLQWCAVKKVYGAIGAGELKTRNLNHFLQSVSLQLKFRGSAKPVSVTFFESQHNTADELPVLEAAAKRWEHVLSQLPPNVLPSFTT